MSSIRCALLMLSFSVAMPADAVMLRDGDGTQNTTAPADDPGWSNVGALSGNGAVLLGNGWVLTADHVAWGNPSFDAVYYTRVVGSEHWVTTAGELVSVRPALPEDRRDVRLFRIHPPPPIPSLPLAAATPPVGTNVVMIGRGYERGAPTSVGGVNGFFFGSTYGTKRWGTNRVWVSSARYVLTSFTEFGGTSDECQAVTHDSGGGVFFQNAGVWQIAGVMVSGSSLSPALFGQTTFTESTQDFASATQALIQLSECNDGLDNDADGHVDVGSDAGCHDAYGSIEDPACNDQIDNDGDGFVDLADSQCGGMPYRTSEEPLSCGSGFELAGLVPLLAVARRLRRR